MFKHLRILFLFFLVLNNYGYSQLSKYVNPFIGTQGTGHTFLGPSMPFSLVQPGPDNRDFGWDYTSGYQFNDTQLLGFSQTRLSGTGINELGDVLLLPLNPKKPSLGRQYHKSSEKACVGLYQVTKKDEVIEYDNFIGFIKEKAISTPLHEVKIDPVEIVRLFKRKPSHPKDYEEKLFMYDKYTAVIDKEGFRFISGNNILKPENIN